MDSVIHRRQWPRDYMQLEIHDEHSKLHIWLWPTWFQCLSAPPPDSGTRFWLSTDCWPTVQLFCRPHLKCLSLSFVSQSHAPRFRPTSKKFWWRTSPACLSALNCSSKAWAMAPQTPTCWRTFGNWRTSSRTTATGCTGWRSLWRYDGVFAEQGMLVERYKNNQSVYP